LTASPASVRIRTVGIPQARTTPRLIAAAPARVIAGRRVKAARLIAGGITVRQLAAAAGLGYQHLAAIERGEHPITTTDATDLAIALDVPSDWLVNGWA
jgi:hypothetical protein